MTTAFLLFQTSKVPISLSIIDSITIPKGIVVTSNSRNTEARPANKIQRSIRDSIYPVISINMFFKKAPRRFSQDIVMGIRSTIAGKLFEPPIVTLLFAESRPNPHRLIERALEPVAVRPVRLSSSSDTWLLQHCFCHLCYYHR
jgi:hypothetical protein